MSNTCIKSGSTVYDGLVTGLRKAIRNGIHKPGEFIATEQALCRSSGISRVSVRRATDLLIREGLIERRPGKGLFVCQPDRAVRTIQVIVPDLAFEQCVQIVRGAQELGAERGFRVQVYDGHNRMDRDIAFLQQLSDLPVEGALILSWHHPRFTEALLTLKQKGLPFVLVDEHADHLDVSSITADNHAGGLMIGNALVDQGHRTFGFIGNLIASTVRARLEGLRDAVGDRGIPFDRSRVLDLAVQPQEDWAERIALCTRQLLCRQDRPTAVLFSDDQVAAEGYRTIRAMGLSVPDDVSIVGFDDAPLCKWIDPPLATVSQPSVEMGRVAMEMLLDALQFTRPAKPSQTRQVTLPVQWIPRASIGAPNRSQEIS